MNLSANLKSIQKTFHQSNQLVAVTKNRTPEEIIELLKAGVTIIAENKIQEAASKFPHLPTTETLPHQRHFIGHLQTNKAKEAIRLFDMIQSVDSLHLAQKINKEAQQQNKKMPILIQINIAKDPKKHGFLTEALATILPQIQALSHIKVQGLMTIVPFHDNPEQTRPYFKALKKLADTHHLPEISMGMSHDYQIAIEEGATMVRLGRILFEEKEQSM